MHAHKKFTMATDIQVDVTRFCRPISASSAKLLECHLAQLVNSLDTGSLLFQSYPNVRMATP